MSATPQVRRVANFLPLSRPRCFFLLSDDNRLDWSSRVAKRDTGSIKGIVRDHTWSWLTYHGLPRNGSKRQFEEDPHKMLQPLKAAVSTSTKKSRARPQERISVQRDSLNGLVARAWDNEHGTCGPQAAAPMSFDFCVNGPTNTRVPQEETVQPLNEEKTYVAFDKSVAHHIMQMNPPLPEMNRVTALVNSSLTGPNFQQYWSKNCNYFHRPDVDRAFKVMIERGLFSFCRAQEFVVIALRSVCVLSAHHLGQRFG